MIYEPGEDSFLLQKYVKKYAKGKVLDLGTGSGIQALTALENTKNVTAVDINKEAVDMVKSMGIRAFVSYLFENLNNENFDLIIFNPPYLPEDKDEGEDSKVNTTGGRKGSEIIERFLKSARGYLNKGGKILLVCSSLSGDVEGLFRKYSFSFKMLEEMKFDFEKIFVYLVY